MDKNLLFCCGYSLLTLLASCSKSADDKEETATKKFSGALIIYNRFYESGSYNIIETYDTTQLEFNVNISKDSIFFISSDIDKFDSRSFKKNEGEEFAGVYNSLINERKSYTFRFIGSDTLKAFFGYSAANGPDAQNKTFAGTFYK